MPTSSPLRVLVVDDESLARRRLRRLLSAEPDVVCVGECAHGQAAVEWLLQQDADVVLLDVQMPEVSGFDVIDMVGVKRMPLVIFVTAFDRYAVHAFGVHAVDYLLKPFDRTRLAQALERARLRLAREPHDAIVAQLGSAVRALAAHRERPDRVLVRRTGAMDFVKIADIEWVEAQGNYAALHVGSQTHLVRETLSRLEDRLDPDQFVRIRRTAIVNVDRIAKLDPWEKDEHVVVMTSGVRITVSRGFSDRLERLLATWRL